MNKKMEFEEEFNPWNVSNVEEFLYFCCPECDFRTEISSGRISFMRHALSAHPRAKNLIESPDESRLNHLIHEESDKNDNMYTEIKQNEPFIPKIKKRNKNDVSELSEVKVEENHLPPDDNFSIPDQNLEPSIVISSVRSMTSETKNDVAKERTGFQKQSKPKQGHNGNHCQFCEANFNTSRGLKYHIRSNHSELELKNKRYKCEECGNRYKNVHGLDCHIASEHKGIRFRCELCKKSFTRKDDVKKHQKVHETFRREKFKCDVCVKGFDSKKNLHKHLRMRKHRECKQKQESLGKKSEINDNFIDMKNCDGSQEKPENNVKVLKITDPKMNPYVLLKRCESSQIYDTLYV